MRQGKLLPCSHKEDFPLSDKFARNQCIGESDSSAPPRSPPAAARRPHPRPPAAVAADPGSLGVWAGIPGVGAAAVASEKQCNTFRAPGTPNECEGWVSIGSQRWPDNAQRGAAEQYMRLCSAVGTFQSSVHALDISAAQYAGGAGAAARYCMAFDVEKFPQAAGTGEDVSSGAICTVFANNVTVAGAGALWPTHAQVACFHDAILSLSDGGAQVHE